MLLAPPQPAPPSPRTTMAAHSLVFTIFINSSPLDPPPGRGQTCNHQSFAWRNALSGYRSEEPPQSTITDPAHISQRPSQDAYRFKIACCHCCDYRNMLAIGI